MDNLTDTLTALIEETVRKVVGELQLTVTVAPLAAAPVSEPVPAPAVSEPAAPSVPAAEPVEAPQHVYAVAPTDTPQGVIQ